MSKKILLVEPAYKTKYPPLGLMKLSTYHKENKDYVEFVKGCNKRVLDTYWDRIYITTLFTWTWKETVKTINFYRDSLFNISEKCFVGGILASLMPDELFNATGIQPIVGLLDDPKKMDQEDNIVIDNLPPDYTILKQVENVNFKYNYFDSYLGYSTRGCVRKCGYCAVRTFEPEFNHYIDIKKMIEQVGSLYGEKQNLLLMDNNVLVSNHFDQIINDIKAAGFFKGAKFGKTGRRRIVDFNQGLDPYRLTEHKMKRLSEIPLEPMRIAFDDIKDKEAYEKSVRLAHRYGQVNMSNYVLYNYKDSPDDFYERLKINIDLNEEFKKDNSGVKTVIYSFPMRYIPLKAKDRNIETGNPHWNRRYLRSLKVILNVTKGPVMPGAKFFYQAFGENAEQFKAILSMPEDFIRNRLVPNWRDINKPEKQWMPYVKHWMDGYYCLSSNERKELIDLLSSNSFGEIKVVSRNHVGKKLKKLLKYQLEAGEIVEKYKR